jgi:outer membrane protein TolC
MKRYILFLSVGALALSACTNRELTAGLLAQEPGFDTVRATASQATRAQTVFLQDAESIRMTSERVHQMVHGRTISADTAVQVALLNNRGLQAAYAELGMTAAQIRQTTLQPNPTMSVGLMGINAEGLAWRTLEGIIATNILAFATSERRSQIADTRFRQAQLRAAEETLRVATETRLAWIEAVSAFEAAGILREAETTADAQSDLASELGQTGFLNRAAQARDQALYAELAGQRARARLDALIAKERLTRLMGLWGTETEYFVPNALAGLPGRSGAPRDAEAQALAQRVDLVSARLELQAVAQEHRLENATRFVTDLELIAGFESERQSAGAGIDRETTPQIEVEFAIPIFDSGEARLRRAEMAYLRAAHQLAERAVAVRSEARAAQAELAGAHQIAKHYRDNLVPLRALVESETLRAYNGMIESYSELLDAIRGRLSAQLAEASARADYWRAEARMTAALYGGGADGGGSAAAPEMAAVGAPGH